MPRVVTRARRLRKEVGVRLFLLEIFDPPGTPKRFNFCFRKFHQVVQSEASLRITAAKSSKVLPRHPRETRSGGLQTAVFLVRRFVNRRLQATHHERTKKM